MCMCDDLTISGCPCTVLGCCDPQALLERGEGGGGWTKREDNHVVGFSRFAVVLVGWLVGFKALNSMLAYLASVGFSWLSVPKSSAASSSCPHPACLKKEGGRKQRKPNAQVCGWHKKSHRVRSGGGIFINNPAFQTFPACCLVTSNELERVWATLYPFSHFSPSLSPALAIALSMLLISTSCGLHGSLGIITLILIELLSRGLPEGTPPTLS